MGQEALVTGYSGVAWTFQEVRSWQNEQVSGFHAGPSAGPHLPPGWRVDGVGGGSFPPKAARSVLRKPGPCCSFYLHCTSQGRALCLPPGTGTVWSHRPGGHRGCPALERMVDLAQNCVLSGTLHSIPIVVTAENSVRVSPGALLTRIHPRWQ